MPSISTFNKVQIIILFQNGRILETTINYIIQKLLLLTKDHFTTFGSEMTLMYEIPWPPATVHYSNNKKTDMILIFGECRLNAVAAANPYAQRYPNRTAPMDTIFRKLEATLCESRPKAKKAKPMPMRQIQQMKFE
jgi:hypothetical protein